METINDIILQTQQELRRGTLVISVLASLKDAQYGYSLIQHLEQKGISIEGNTLYPLLRRLEKQTLLESKWDVDSSKPRKYYVVTKNGILVLEALQQTWLETVKKMNDLLGGLLWTTH